VILAPDEQGAVVTAEKRPAALLVKMPNDIDVLVAWGEIYCMTSANRIPEEPDGRSESSMGVQAMAADGLLTIRSSYGPEETMIRFEAEVKEKGMTVFARVDHAAGAAAVGLSLRPTDLLIFGNARGGTPLMQSSQAIGIDLPIKALVWQDASGDTWLSYNDPTWIAKRHGLGHEVDATVNAISAALDGIARTATTSP